MLPALTGIFALLGLLALDEEGWMIATPWILFLICGIGALATN